jgi:hypothetical protein
MHIYYSNDDEPDWDFKLWIPIPKSYILKKGFHSLPQTVYARYLKLEFSNLTAAPYNSIDYPVAPPITYRKFPTWVQSHFHDIYNIRKATQGSFVNPFDRVTIDPLVFGFLKQDDKMHSQYQDLRGTVVPTSTDEIKEFIATITQTVVTTDTVQQLQESNIVFRSSFMWQDDLLLDLPGNRALGRYIQATESDFAAELAPFTDDAPDVQSVSNLSDERIRKELPSMYFPRKCRHEYQILKTTRPTKVAYYVAIRDVALYRRDFSVRYDEPIYFESLDDTAHTSINEFTQDEYRFVVLP